jgi:hypothetical protein
LNRFDLLTFLDIEGAIPSDTRLFIPPNGTRGLKAHPFFDKLPYRVVLIPMFRNFRVYMYGNVIFCQGFSLHENYSDAKTVAINIAGSDTLVASIC